MTDLTDTDSSQQTNVKACVDMLLYQNVSWITKQVFYACINSSDNRLTAKVPGKCKGNVKLNIRLFNLFTARIIDCDDLVRSRDIR